MSGAAALDEVLRDLLRRGLTEAEVMRKRGRSRRLVLELDGESAAVSQEAAWAVRASSRRASFFAAGAGELPAAAGSGGADGSGGPGGWPEPTGRPFRLPEPETAPPWAEPADFETPLIGESEGLRLLAGLGRELAAELPGSRLLHAALEDGSSEGELASSRGLRVRFRRRLSTLRLEAAGPGRPAASAALYLAAREARHFQPAALARRLADRLSLVARGAPPRQAAAAGGPAGSGILLLAPPVGAALLAGLLPLLVGPGAVARVAPLRDRRGRIGGERLTIADNGRLAGGALECPGRDLPTPGPTHLYVKPDPRQAVAGLLGDIAAGHYLLDTTGPLRCDPAGDAFALPVCGFSVESGRASAPIAGAWLCGTSAALLKGIAAVARDLSFLPLDGMIGSPTLLVKGLELRGRQ